MKNLSVNHTQNFRRKRESRKTKSEERGKTLFSGGVMKQCKTKHLRLAVADLVESVITARTMIKVDHASGR